MTQRRDSGFVLITVLLVTVVLAVLVLGTAATSLIDRQVSAAQRDATRAYYSAQAGLERLMTAVFLNYAGVMGDGELIDFCGTPIDTGIDLGDGLLLQGEWRSFALEGGFYRLQYTLSGDLIVLRSEGYVGGTLDMSANQVTSPRGKSSLQAIATLRPAGEGSYTNAVMTPKISRMRGSNRLVGRVAVFGSMHVVDNDVDLTDPETGVVGEIGGNSGIFNNYFGDSGTGTGGNTVLSNAESMLGFTRSRLPDLCSRVKIDNGNLMIQKGVASNLGASSSETDQTRNPNALQGLYFGTGTLVEKDGNDPPRPVAATPENRVYVKNPIGYYSSFEQQIPGLKSGFPLEQDQASPRLDLDQNSGTACPLVANDTSGPQEGGGIALRLPPPSLPSGGIVNCGNGSLVYDGTVTPPRVTINGNVNVTGMNVVIDPGSRIQVAGSGAIRVAGDITVNGGIVPTNPDTYLLEGGTNFGLVASGTVNLNATASNPDIAAIVYGRLVELSGQAVVAGAIVANEEVIADGARVMYHPDVAAAATRIGMPETNPDDEAGREFSRFSIERN